MKKFPAIAVCCLTAFIFGCQRNYETADYKRAQDSIAAANALDTITNKEVFDMSVQDTAIAFNVYDSNKVFLVVDTIYFHLNKADSLGDIYFNARIPALTYAVPGQPFVYGHIYVENIFVHFHDSKGYIHSDYYEVNQSLDTFRTTILRGTYISYLTLYDNY